MNQPATIALLGAPARAEALRARLPISQSAINWADTPQVDVLNLLLDPDNEALRQHLLSHGLPFQVARDETQALRAIGAWLGKPLVETNESLRLGRGRWVCESCSDPECEHRLFRDLLARRG